MNDGQGLSFHFDSGSDGVSPPSFRSLDGDGGGGVGSVGVHPGLADDVLLDHFVLDDGEGGGGGPGAAAAAGGVGGSVPSPSAALPRGVSPPLGLPPGLGAAGVLGADEGALAAGGRGGDLSPLPLLASPPRGGRGGGLAVVGRGDGYPHPRGGDLPHLRATRGGGGSGSGSGGRSVKLELGLAGLPPAALHHPAGALQSLPDFGGGRGLHALAGVSPTLGLSTLAGMGVLPSLGVPLGLHVPPLGLGGAHPDGLAQPAAHAPPAGAGLLGSPEQPGTATRHGAPAIRYPSPGATGGGGRASRPAPMDESPAQTAAAATAAVTAAAASAAPLAYGEDPRGGASDGESGSGGEETGAAPTTAVATGRSRRRSGAVAAAAAAVAAAAAAAGVGAAAAAESGATAACMPTEGGTGGGPAGSPGDAATAADTRRMRAKRNREAAARSRTKSKANLEQVEAAHRHASGVNVGLRDLLTHLLHPERALAGVEEDEYEAER